MDFCLDRSHVLMISLSSSTTSLPKRQRYYQRYLAYSVHYQATYLPNSRPMPQSLSYRLTTVSNTGALRKAFVGRPMQMMLPRGRT